MSHHRLYQGVRSKKIFSKLNTEDESAITQPKDEIPKKINFNKKKIKVMNKEGLEAGGTCEEPSCHSKLNTEDKSVITQPKGGTRKNMNFEKIKIKAINKESSSLSSATMTCEKPSCHSSLHENHHTVKQIQIDKYERVLLERQYSCKSNLLYPKSLSLSNLTVDNTPLIGSKHNVSVPSLFIYQHEIIHLNERSTNTDFGPKEKENANHFPNTEVIHALCNNNTTPQKSLSLSDLTQDNQAKYKLNKRPHSAPPGRKILDKGCMSPSILLFTAALYNDDDCNPSENDPGDDSMTNCETSSDEEYGDMNEGRKRRHVARKEDWKKNQAQRKRMRGEEYLGYSKPRNEKMRQDRVRAAKELGQTCTSQFCRKSKFRGCSRFDEETRRSIHAYFWKKLNWDERRIYVRELITRTATNRKTKGEDDSRREGTLNYFLPQKNNEGKIQVCKQMFLNTLSLKSTAVQKWAKKDRFVVANDESCQSSSEASILDSKRSNLNNFLTSIPKMPSHYARKDTTKLYLEPLYRTMTDVYNVYKQYCIDKNVLPAVSRYTFDNVFKKKNLALYTLKKDMCDTCIGYKEGNIDGHIFQEHIIKKNRARQEKEEDKKKAAKGEVILLTMDLEAVKVCPYLTASALYFKTKLTCHNFTCFDLTTRQCTCYWFTETAADLTASTFASFLIDYLERHCLQKQKPIIIFSDGCTYQNRNVILANALLNFSLKNKVTITQKFLEKGHTQMECDSVHSAIERKLTNREIYLPCDYISVTKEARASFPYEVVQIDHNFVKNYANKSTWLYNSIRPGCKTGDPAVTDIRAILYDQEETIKVKLHFDQEWLQIPQRPKRNKSAVTYAPLHNQMIPISASKYQHLQDLKSVLPRECHDFYDSLPHS